MYINTFPTGDVRMPSGKVAKPVITDNKDGTVTVKYAPTEAGLHEMDIKYDGIHIPGEPKARQRVVLKVNGESSVLQAFFFFFFPPLAMQH